MDDPIARVAVLVEELFHTKVIIRPTQEIVNDRLEYEIIWDGIKKSFIGRTARSAAWTALIWLQEVQSGKRSPER